MFLTGIKKRVNQEYWVQFMIPHFKGDFHVPEKGERIKYQVDERQEAMSLKNWGCSCAEKELFFCVGKYSHIEDGVIFFCLSFKRMPKTNDWM